MDTLSLALTYINLSLLPSYIIYVGLYEPTFERRLSKKVYKDRVSFFNNKGKIRGWRIAYLYESYKNEFELSPETFYSVEVNMGSYLHTNWKTIMVSKAVSHRDMLSKFYKEEMGNLPKSLKKSDYFHTQGKEQSRRLALFVMALLPFSVEIISMVTS